MGVRLFIILLFVETISITKEVYAQKTLQDSIKLFQWERFSLQKDIVKLDSILEPLKVKRVDRVIKSVGLPEKNDDLIIQKMDGYILGKKSGQIFPSISVHVLSKDLLASTRKSRKYPDENNIELFDSAIVSQLEAENLELVSIIPLADIKWSEIMLESLQEQTNLVPIKKIFYYNIWSDLETMIRKHFYDEKSAIIVATGLLFNEESSISQLEADYFYKAAVSLTDSLSKGIAFLIPHSSKISVLEKYAISIDSLQRVTNINFFPNLSDSISRVVKNSIKYDSWIPKYDSSIVFKPLGKFERPRNTLNTEDVKLYQNSKKKLTVCGTVTGAFLSSNGHYILNLDQPYPQQSFSFTILKDDLRNFSYNPEEYLKHKKICVNGLLNKSNDRLGMFIGHEKHIDILP
ncbi:MAG: DNA/RNA non-specific endonuclease [Bacteroidota bacterium]